MFGWCARNANSLTIVNLNLLTIRLPWHSSGYSWLLIPCYLLCTVMFPKCEFIIDKYFEILNYILPGDVLSHSHVGVWSSYPFSSLRSGISLFAGLLASWLVRLHIAIVFRAQRLSGFGMSFDAECQLMPMTTSFYQERKVLILFCNNLFTYLHCRICNKSVYICKPKHGYSDIIQW